MKCLIFKVVSTGADGAIKHITLLNGHLSELRTRLSTNGIKGLFIDKDTIALRKFSQEIIKFSNGKYHTYIDAYNNSMLKASESAKITALEIDKLATKYKAGKISLAEYNAQVQELTLSEKEMSVASKLVSTGMTLLANALPIIAISLLVTAISKYKQNLEEIRQKQDEAAQSAKEETEKLESLYDKYKSLSEEVKTNDSAKDDLKSTTDDLLKLLGIEEDQVDNLIKKYGTLDDVIDRVTYDTLLQSRGDLGTDVENKRNDLKGAFRGLKNKDSISGLMKEEVSKKIEDIITDLGYEAAMQINNSINGFELYHDLTLNLKTEIDTSSMDGIQELYDTYQTMMRRIEEELGSEAFENPFYKSLSERVGDLKPLIDAYSDSLNTYDDNVTRGLIIEKKWADGVPENAEAFEIWRKELIEAAKADKNFFDDSDIEGSIDKALGSMTEFSQYMSDFSHTTENVEFTVKPTFAIDESSITESLTTLKENIDDILKNADLFDKAIESMTKGESISFDDMMKLIGLDPSLADKFTQTADGYKATLEDLNEARKNYIQDTQDTLSESIQTNNAFVQQIQQNIVDLQAKRAEYAKHINSQDDVKNLEKYDAQIAYQQELLERVQQTNAESSLYQTELNTTYKAGASAVQSYDDVLKDLANKESLLDSIHKEMNDDGSISVSTYQKLIELGDDYSDLVTIENGKLKINETAFKNLVIQQYREQDATKDLITEEAKAIIKEHELTKAKKIRQLAAMGATGATQEEMQAIRDEIADEERLIQTLKASGNLIAGMFENYDPKENGSGSSPKTKASYSNDLQLLKDQLNDRVITYEQFLQRWQALNDKYHNMSEEDGGISDYEWGQNNREIIEARKNAYEEEKKSLQEMYEAGTISLDEYNTRVNAALTHWLGGYAQLSDDFKDKTKENAEFAKTHFFDEIDRELEDLKNKYDKTGDVSFLNSREKTAQSGYDQATAKLNSLYAQGYTDANEDVQFWLKQQEKYSNELEDILKEREDIVEDNLSNERKAFDEAYSKNGDNSVFAEEIKSIETAKQGYLDLIEEYKKLGYTENSDKIKELRKQVDELDKDILEVNKKLADSIVDIADKNVETIEREITKTGDTSKYNDIITTYKTAQDKINALIQEGLANGEDENGEYIQNLRKQYNELGDNIVDIYNKIGDNISNDMKEQLDAVDREIKQTGDTSKYQIKLNILADTKKEIQELIETFKKLGFDANSEVIKDLESKLTEIDDEIIETTQDRVDAQIQAYEEVMELETKELEKYKKEQDEIFDSKIKALEDQKKVLEDQNKEIEKQKELEEKKLSIIEAQRGVYKSLKMVYTGNGGWSIKPSQESLDALKDAEEDLKDTERKQQIDGIDDLISGIEEQKKTFDNAIDKQVEAIEDGVTTFKETLEAYYKTYAQLDGALLTAILGEDSANEIIKKFDEVLEKHDTNSTEDISSKKETSQTSSATDKTQTSSTSENTSVSSTSIVKDNEKIQESSDEAAKSVDGLDKSTKQLGKTSVKAVAELNTFADEMQKEYGLGNVDLTKRPFVSGEKMRKAGYDVDKNGTSTVYSSTHFVWQGDEKHGKYVAVHVTPILPNGEVLSEKELEDYVYGQLEGSKDILKADSKGVVLKVDTDLNLSENDIASLDSGKLTKHMQKVLNDIDQWDIDLHNVQEEWMNLWFEAYGNPTKKTNNREGQTIDFNGSQKYEGFLGSIQKILSGAVSLSSLGVGLSSEALNQLSAGKNIAKEQTINTNSFNPTVTNNITVNVPNGDANEISQTISNAIESKVIQGLRSFYDGYYQQSMKELHSY